MQIHKKDQNATHSVSWGPVLRSFFFPGSSSTAISSIIIYMLMTQKSIGPVFKINLFDDGRLHIPQIFHVQHIWNWSHHPLALHQNRSLIFPVSVNTTTIHPVAPARNLVIIDSFLSLMGINSHWFHFINVFINVNIYQNNTYG